VGAARAEGEVAVDMNSRLSDMAAGNCRQRTCAIIARM
jgi:hypothetical protein